MKQSKVYGVCMCYNEADIIGELIANCWKQKFDGLILLDHFSDDGTRGVIEEAEYISSKGFDFAVYYTGDRAFNKVRKINGLGAMAHARAWEGSDYDGDTWVVPMDVDEEWTTADGKPLGDMLRAAVEEEIGFYNHMRNFILTPQGYRRWYLTACDARKQIRGEKCCYIYRQYRWVTSGFHNVMERGEFNGDKVGAVRPTRNSNLVVNHYPYRSFEQVRSKYRNLLEAILLQKRRSPDHDRHSIERGEMSDEDFIDFFYHNCFVENPEDDVNLFDAEA